MIISRSAKSTTPARRLACSYSRVDLGDPLRGRRRSRDRPPGHVGVAVRPGKHGLGPVDLRRDVPQFGPVDPQLQPRCGVADDAQRSVEYVGHGAAEDPRREVLQLAQGSSVERAGLHAMSTELAQPGAELTGRPCGERDGEQLSGRDGAGTHLEGDPVGDRASLAGAGTGEDADRAADRLSGGTLFGVQPAQHRLGIGHAASLPARADSPGMAYPGAGFSPDADDVHDGLVRFLRAAEGATAG